MKTREKTPKADEKERNGKPHPPDAQKHAGYTARTRLIHGKSKTAKWDYSHHVIPPISSSATFRLSSSQRGDRKSTRLNSSHIQKSRMPSSA